MTSSIPPDDQNSLTSEQIYLRNFDAVKASPPHAAMVAAIHGQLAGAAQAGIDLPEDPNQASFDVNIQDYYNAQTGQYNIQKFMNDAIQTPLYYLYAEDPDNPNASIDVMQALTQLGGVWNQLSPSQQSYVQSFLGQSLSSGNSSSGNFATTAVDILAGIEYFCVTPPPGVSAEQNTINFLNNLQTALAPIAGTAPWLQQMSSRVQYLAGNFDAGWVSIYGNLGLKTFEFAVGLRTEQIFLNDNLMTSFFNNMKSNQIQNAVEQAGGNVQLLYILLIMILFGQGDQLQMQQAGGGVTLNLLTDRTNEANSLVDLWNTGSSGTMTPTQAASFVQTLQQAQFYWQDGRLSSVSDTINGAIGQFLDPNNSVTVPTGTGVPADVAGKSLGSIISDVTTPGSPDYGNNQMLADAFNACQYSAGDSTTNPPTPPMAPPTKNTLTLALQQIQTSASQQSNSISQQMQTTEGIVEKDQTLLASAIQVITDFAKAIVQNMQSAGS